MGDEGEKKYWLPLKIVFTVAKYDPMGTTTMAKVKARSLRITSLVCCVSCLVLQLGMPLRE